jgi:hypothetical protein
MTRTTIVLAALTAATLLLGCNEKTESAPAAKKTVACGEKGQQMCPMQGWMKTVMTQASSSGEAGEIAKALGYVAQRSPPGYAQWTTIAEAGVAKAKAGDVDGAKAACKQCHDLYKDRYKQEMRDRPF